METFEKQPQRAGSRDDRCCRDDGVREFAASEVGFCMFTATVQTDSFSYAQHSKINKLFQKQERRNEGHSSPALTVTHTKAEVALGLVWTGMISA